jgi:hypothetical protein
VTAAPMSSMSVIVGVVGVFFGSLAGGLITAQFPPWLTDAFKVHLLPAVLGAVFEQSVLRGPVYAVPALLIAGVPLLLGWKAYFIIPIAVFGTLAVGYALFQWKGIAPRAGRSRPEASPCRHSVGLSRLQRRYRARGSQPTAVAACAFPLRNSASEATRPVRQQRAQSRIRLLHDSALCGKLAA